MLAISLPPMLANPTDSGLDWTPILVIAILFVAVVFLFKSAVIVPNKYAFIVERLGKYSRTLEAGIHILIPIIDRIAYRHSLKEVAIDVPSQMCITKDNISIEIDGILYMQVLDPVLASYGIQNYTYAATQLAQTSLRSEIGKLELDRTFEERECINANIIAALDKASEPWGLKITRYEIANIKPPQSVRDALEKQMRAERERRAQIARSEGEREAAINVAEGQKQKIIKESEAKKQLQINEAEGKAREIELIARATADGIDMIAKSIQSPGGQSAVNLRIAEQYVKEFGNLARTNNTLILPANLTDIGGAVAGLATILKKTQSPQAPACANSPEASPATPTPASSAEQPPQLPSPQTLASILPSLPGNP